MALVYATNFEDGSGELVYSVNGSPSIQNSTLLSGNYSLRCSASGAAVCSWEVLPPSGNGLMPTTGVSNAYTKFDFQYATKPTSGDEIIFWVSTYSGSKKIELRLDASGVLKFYDKDNSLVATGTTVLADNTKYSIEVRSGNGTSAAYEVRINGVTEFSGTCNQIADVNSGFRFGKIQNRNSNTIDFFYDQVIILDDQFPGPNAAVTTLLAIANGSTAQWSAGTNSSDHLEVDELVPDNDTTYIKNTSSADDIHLFSVESASSKGINGNIYGVLGIVRAREEGATSSAFRVRIKSGATTAETSSADPGNTNYATYTKVQSTDPNTGSAWQPSALDSIEVGVRQINSSSLWRCTKVQARVAYLPKISSNLLMMGIG